ncbi:unnamed protein product, partial [Brenthis ino]
MLLTIHNLPPNITLAGIKQLIKDNCNISEVILDNFLNEGQGKRVTVGLADEGDAALLVRKINGMFMNGYHIFVEDIRQKKTEQPYCPMNIPQITVPEMQNPQFEIPMNMPTLQASQLMPTAYSSMPFYMSPVQNKYITYNTSAPLVNPVQPAPFYQQSVPFENQWKEQAITYPVSGSNQTPEVDTRQYSPRPQETNWRDRSPSGINEGHDRRDRESFDRSRDKNSRWNVHNNEQRSSQRSEYRRDDDNTKGNRNSRAERSPPRDRYENRDGRDGKFDNRRGPNRGEQNRERFDNQNFDHRRPNRDVGQNNQDHKQKRDFGSKRSYAEHSQANTSTYSNNPNNSTFTQTKSSNFQSEFKRNESDTNYHGPPNKISRQVDNKSLGSTNSPGKMNPPVETFPQKTQSGPNPKNSLQAKLNRHKTWIGMACSQLATAITKNAGGGFIPYYGEFNKQLKRCIVSRIEVILHDHITSSFDEVIIAYRSKFTVDDDPGFFQAVMQKHKRDLKLSDQPYTGNNEGNIQGKKPKASSSSTNNKDGFGTNQNQQGFSRPKKGPKPKAAKGQANFKQQESNKNATRPNFKNIQNPQLDISKPSDLSQRLPKYPKGDKQIYKDQKKLEKLEVTKEVYTLEPVLKKALDEEMKLFCDEFIAACMEPSKKEDENYLRLKIKDVVLPKFKQIVELHLTKRLLNISNNLVIRIFSHPKMPKRDVLDEFLKQYDVASLKKSDKKRLYLATCANYKTYDDLLHLAKATVGDNIMLHFKPLNLTPKISKNANKMQRRAYSQPENNMDIEDVEGGDDQGDEYGDPDDNEDDVDDDTKFDDNIYPDDNDIHSDDVQEKSDDTKPRLDDSDVVLLETKNEVVVIEDNDKSPNKISDDVKNNEPTDGPNLNKDDDVNKNIATVDDQENKASSVENNDEKNSDQVEKFDEGVVDEVHVGDDDLEDF